MSWVHAHVPASQYMHAWRDTTPSDCLGWAPFSQPGALLPQLYFAGAVSDMKSNPLLLANRYHPFP